MPTNNFERVKQRLNSALGNRDAADDLLQKYFSKKTVDAMIVLVSSLKEKHAAQDFDKILKDLMGVSVAQVDRNGVPNPRAVLAYLMTTWMLLDLIPEDIWDEIKRVNEEIDLLEKAKGNQRYETN